MREKTRRKNRFHEDKNGWDFEQRKREAKWGFRTKDSGLLVDTGTGLSSRASSYAISNPWVVGDRRGNKCGLSRKITGVLEFWKGNDRNKEIIHIN